MPRRAAPQASNNFYIWAKEWCEGRPKTADWYNSMKWVKLAKKTFDKADDKFTTMFNLIRFRNPNSNKNNSHKVTYTFTPAD